MSSAHKLLAPQPLPAEGFVRLPQILAAFPVSKSTWWKGVKEGRFPQPVRPSPFGPAITVWRAAEVRSWIERAGTEAG